VQGRGCNGIDKCGCLRQSLRSKTSTALSQTAVGRRRFRGGGGWDVRLPLAPTRDRRIARELGRRPSGSPDTHNHRVKGIEGELTQLLNERTRRARFSQRHLGFAEVWRREVVLVGDAAENPAALDSRQAAAKRADRDRRAVCTPRSAVRPGWHAFWLYTVSAQWASLASRSALDGRLAGWQASKL